MLTPEASAEAPACTEPMPTRSTGDADVDEELSRLIAIEAARSGVSSYDEGVSCPRIHAQRRMPVLGLCLWCVARGDRALRCKLTYVLGVGVQYLVERSRIVDYVSWLAGRLGLMDETVHTGMELVDRFWKRVRTRGMDLLLAAVVSLVVAAKYSELTQDEQGLYTPSYSHVLAAMDNPKSLTVRTLAAIEIRILRVLDWRLSTATPLSFLAAYLAKGGHGILCASTTGLLPESRVRHDQAKQVWRFAEFFCNLATQRGFSCIFGASVSAAAAIVAARTVANVHPASPQGLAQCLKVEAHAQIAPCLEAMIHHYRAEYPEHAYNSRSASTSPTNVDTPVTTSSYAGITTSAMQTSSPSPSDTPDVQDQPPTARALQTSVVGPPAHSSCSFQSPAGDEHHQNTTGYKRKPEDAELNDEQPKLIRR